MRPTQSIDLTTILQQTVSTGYADLVTRPTGKAVRSGVEEHLAVIDDRQVIIIDFSGVRCLDFSCADEIVGKLLLSHGNARYFVLRGVAEIHSEAIEAVLERYDIAVVAQQRCGTVRVLGPASDTVRETVQVLERTRTIGVREVAVRLSIPQDNARKTLDEVVERRLGLAADDQVISLA